MVLLPVVVVAADRNPFIENISGVKKDFTLYNPRGTREQVRASNSSAHGSDGQNVIFLDSHVEFLKSPDIGINEDCIYTSWSANPPTNSIRIGVAPLVNSTLTVPKSREDAVLLNDGVP
jgi:hypothetical protein